VRKFDVKQADLTIEGHFAKPDLALLRADRGGLVEILSGQLARYGVTLNDITFGSGNSLADRYALFYQPRMAVGIKATVAKLEVGFNDVLRITFTDVRAVTTEAFETLSKAAPHAKVMLFGATLNVHGIIEGVTPVEFLKSHTAKAPDSLGPSTGGAAGFYYGEDGPRKSLAIIMDGSALYQGAVYLRITTAFDGQTPKVVDAGREVVRRAFAALGLQPMQLDLG
jgi:hypothetical protein